MKTPPLGKFGFRIRTRAGLVIESLLIPGRDEEEAERKLLQLYRDCEILARFSHKAGSASSKEGRGKIVRLAVR